mgnify:FL=1
MMLSEVTPVPDATLPLEPFKAHLRLGTGFAESGLQDGLLVGFLRAALAAIEKRTGKALLQRGFLWRLDRWGQTYQLSLPLAPVTEVTRIDVFDANGAQESLELADFWLEPDPQEPRLHRRSTCYPQLSSGAYAEIDFTAGMAPTWSQLPSDLAQAVLMLAAHYYEYRDDTALHGGCMPFGVTSLIERYRALRLSARGAG